jgi:hypothetical protein
MLNFGEVLHDTPHHNASVAASYLARAAFNVRLNGLRSSLDDRFTLDESGNISAKRNKFVLKPTDENQPALSQLESLEGSVEEYERGVVKKSKKVFIGTDELSTGDTVLVITDAQKKEIHGQLEKFAGGEPAAKVLSKALSRLDGPAISNVWHENEKEYTFRSPMNADKKVISQPLGAEVVQTAHEFDNVQTLSASGEEFILEFSSTNMFNSIGVGNKRIYVDPRESDHGRDEMGVTLQCLQAKAAGKIFISREAAEKGDLKFNHEKSEMRVDYSGSFSMPELPSDATLVTAD